MQSTKLKTITRSDDAHLFIYDFNMEPAIFSCFFSGRIWVNMCDGDEKQKRMRLWWCVGIMEMLTQSHTFVRILCEGEKEIEGAV